MTTRANPARPWEVFTWTFPGGPLRITIPFNLIARLQTEIDNHYSRSTDTTPVEMGGVLLGREGALPDTLDIVDYIRVPSGTGDGKYSWSVNPFRRISPSDPMRTVGYFRTEWGDTLTLRDDELGGVQQYFPDRSSVVLLIQGSPQDRKAGFLFWDGDVFAPFSFMDFPFDAEILKREASPEPVLPAVRSEAVDPPQKPAQEPAPQKQESVPQKRAKASKSLSPTALWLIATAVLILAVGMDFLARYYLGPYFRTGTDSLQLEVARQANEINLRWNSRSRPVSEAREGLLTVLDGDRPPRRVSFNAEQLKTESVYYTAATERVEFRLEVSDSLGRVSKDSVIVMSSDPQCPALPDAAASPATISSPGEQPKPVPRTQVQ